ncbi:MAG: glycosyltransferase family 39 protein [Candidatus Beckwithbacteria bacterium]
MMSRKLIWLILLIALLIRLPSLFKPHIENDEVILQTLTRKVAKNFYLSDYTLRGEEILADLPKDLYDTALFLRPPGFVLVSSLFWRLSNGAVAALMLVPVLGGLISVGAIYMIGELLEDRAVGLMSSMILAVEPVLLFSTTKFWTDGWLTGLVTLAIFFFG